MNLPIRILGQLGYKNLQFIEKIFPNLQQLKFTRIDDFYELLICYKTYKKMLVNSHLKLLLCYRLMGTVFQPKKVVYHMMAIINRIYRVLNPLPNSGVLVPRLITRRCFNHISTKSIKFHEIYPIMATGTSSCHIWQIKSDNTYELVSSLQNSMDIKSFISVAFHPKLPLLATGTSYGIVMLAKFNIDGTNAKILNTTTINKGEIWSIVFHPNLPIVYVSNDYGYLMVLKFTYDYSNLLDISLLRPHEATINGIAIQRNGRFLATCSDDYTAKISTFESDECKQIKTIVTFTTYRKILCIDIHPTLDLIVFGSDDKSAKIWQINEDFTTTCIKTFHHPAGVRCVQFDPYNWNIITGCYDGNVRIWNFEDEEKVKKPIHIFRKSPSIYSSVLSIGFSPNRPRIFAIGNNEITICKLE
jgi:WD40 repeat protein